MPVFKTSALDNLDGIFEYMPWSCSGGEQLMTIDQIEAGHEQAGSPQEHPHGFEPTNIEDGSTDGGEWDIDGTVIVSS